MTETNFFATATTNASDAEIPEYSEERQTLYTRNLVKTYGKRTVVNDVSFNVRQGEIVGLLGPNGAGKTTSFYMTTGLVVPNGGKVFINNMEITTDPVSTRAKKGVGYLAQEASVFRTMSVEDNLMTVLEMKYKSIEEQHERLESLLNEFRLQKVRKNRGNQLSGGERRRCEIARCLAIDPKFIMLDEPFAGVDPIAVEDIQYIVWKLKDRNIGILITDHNVQETLCITDRAYLLFEGRILFKGTPPELASNTIVKEKYLGSNFVLRPKDFQVIDEKRKLAEMEEEKNN
ncbi:MAG: LPS export ABC transporter ATP-binding protein [Bacteroidaceae bacterium]|nr:LPS export ABC transporter ATP-binding protein [Bacteroidaceae bacterium]